MKLLDYDPKRKCPKCGHNKVGTSYHEASRRAWDRCPYCENDQWAKEHLARTCQRCHYEWAEKILSKEVVEK